MSLDLRIKYESFNYTYNVSCMWYAIFPEDNGMVEIEGLTGRQALKKLNYFHDALVSMPAFFEAMNPENGWGSYDTFLQFIDKLIVASHNHLNCKWYAGR